MSGQFALVFYVFVGSAAVIGGISQLPALTEDPSTVEIGSEMQIILAQEKSYCQSYGAGINCQCFAEKSGQILAHSGSRDHRYLYADQQDLARGQARKSC